MRIEFLEFPETISGFDTLAAKEEVNHLQIQSNHGALGHFFYSTKVLIRCSDKFSETP